MVEPALLRAAGVEDADALNAQVREFFVAGKYAEAIPIAERALAMSEQALGPEHLDLAIPLNNLALLYKNQGRYAEAEPLYKRAIGIYEKAFDPSHPALAAPLSSLAELNRAQGRYVEAEQLCQRALAILERARGPEHLDVATLVDALAGVYQDQGRYSEAQPLFERARATRERALGPEDPAIAGSLNNVAELYRAQSLYAQAEPLYLRALAILENALGPDQPAVATSLNNLAELYQGQGRYAEAEPRLKRALDIREKAFGIESYEVAQSLHNLAELYRAETSYNEAEPLYKRALGILEKTVGPDHPDVATTVGNLAALRSSQHRYRYAGALYRRALAIRERTFGPDHPDVATTLNDLAGMYRIQGHYRDAEPLYQRSLAIWEKTVGPDHPHVATSLNNLAELYSDEARFTDAEPLYERSVAIVEKTFGSDHPQLAASLNNIAWLSLAQRKWDRAADFWRQAGAILQRREVRDGGVSQNGDKKSEATRNSWFFSGRIKTESRISAQPRYLDEASKAALFEAAQWAQSSEAAKSLAQMAERGAAGDAELAMLVRERQDLTHEWQNADQQLIGVKGRLPNKRIPEEEKIISDRMSAIDTRLAEIDATLTGKFPNFAALTSPRAVALADVQKQLGGNEALVLFLVTDEQFKPLPEETFVWVVTKTQSRWIASDLGAAGLNEIVQTLRCGLDKYAWLGNGQALCNALLGRDLKSYTPTPLPFSTAKARELYLSLFGDVQDLLVNPDGTGKSLILVPSGALTRLPFQVLITPAQIGDPVVAQDRGRTVDQPVRSQAATADRPSDAFRLNIRLSGSAARTDYADTPWLIKRHALTVLPSVASLIELRRERDSQKSTGEVADARDPFIGFGNPKIRSCRIPAATDKCPDSNFHVAPVSFQENARDIDSGDDGEAVADLVRGGNMDVAALKRICALPETEQELKCVARSLGAPANSVVTGADMTETNLKAADLYRFRVLQFATHGLIAGETAIFSKQTVEPALLMTPPEVPTALDDGLLTASEIAGLELNADWVVMSACNTAAARAPDAEALSGLAKAFFYAGARALLVSHWPVNSAAATILTTRTFAELKRAPSIGRSEALRLAMLGLLSDKSWPGSAHPSIWAPFVIVGEGGAIEER